MKLILPAMALLAAALVCAPARAQSESDGQQACGNDAFSLCGDAIPDRGRIEACLRRNYSRVSVACRRYMASYGRTHHTRHVERHHYRHTHASSHTHVARRSVRHHHRSHYDDR